MFENSLHYVAFNDRECVERAVDDYDSLIIQTHIVVGGQGQITPRLNRLYQDEDIEFYIDPAITQLRVGDYFRDDDGELSEYWKKWAKQVGDPVYSHLKQHRNLSATDFSEDERQAISKSLCDLQENFVKNSAIREADKYAQISASLGPKAVIPWYTQITDSSDIAQNRELIENFQQYADTPVKPCIWVSKSFLKDSEGIQSIANLLEEVDVSEAFIWVDELSKKNTTVREYANTTRLTEEISNRDIDPHFLYGNYFVTLLRYFGAKGTGFGKYFLESRSEKTTGGGSGDLTRYYFEPAQEFLNITDVDRLVQKEEPELCDCRVCKVELDDWEDIFRVGDDKLFLQRHFVSSKRIHSKKTEENSLKDLLKELKSAKRTYGSELERTKSSKNAYHLTKWTAGIEHYVEQELGKSLEDYEPISE